jgi:hypothetical protein
LLWHAARFEWRSLAWAAGVTAAIATVSFAFSSDLWLEWFGLLADNADQAARISVLPLPLLVRLPIAAVLIVFGARTDRAWLVPIGVMVALPNVWTSSTALLAATASLWTGRAIPSRPEVPWRGGGHVADYRPSSSVEPRP